MGGAEDATRKRLTFAPNEASNADGPLRATAKRRTDSAEAPFLREKLNEALAMLDICKGVLHQHGVACPEHLSMQGSPEDEDLEDGDEDDDNDFMGFEGIYRHTEQQSRAPAFNGARASTDDMDAGASPDYTASCPNRSDVRLQCIGVNWCDDPERALLDCSGPCTWNFDVCVVHGQNARLPLFRNHEDDVRLLSCDVNWCDNDAQVVHPPPFACDQTACLDLSGEDMSNMRLSCSASTPKCLNDDEGHVQFSCCFDGYQLACYVCACVCECRMHVAIDTHFQASFQLASGSSEVLCMDWAQCDFCQRHEQLERLECCHVDCLASSPKPSALGACLTCGLTTCSLIQMSECLCSSPLSCTLATSNCCCTHEFASVPAVPRGLKTHVQLKKGSPCLPAHATYMTESDRWSPPDFTPLPEDQDDDLPDFDGDRDEPAKVDSSASAPGSQPASTESATASDLPEPAAKLDKDPPQNAVSQMSVPTAQPNSQISPPAPVAIPDAEPE
eukprot:6481725-Amphidinium_carterae.1